MRNGSGPVNPASAFFVRTRSACDDVVFDSEAVLLALLSTYGWTTLPSTAYMPSGAMATSPVNPPVMLVVSEGDGNGVGLGLGDALGLVDGVVDGVVLGRVLGLGVAVPVFEIETGIRGLDVEVGNGGGPNGVDPGDEQATKADTPPMTTDVAARSPRCERFMRTSRLHAEADFHRTA